MLIGTFGGTYGGTYRSILGGTFGDIFRAYLMRIQCVFKAIFSGIVVVLWKLSAKVIENGICGFV